MHRGYVKQWRCLKEWEWYKTPHMVHFFGHIIREASHKDTRWQGVDVKRGQLICGRKKLAQDTGLSERSVRTCLNRLKSTNEVTIETTSRFSIITVNEYEKYQSSENVRQQNVQQTANKRPTSDQQTTTYNNNNNYYNEEEDNNSVVDKEIIKWLKKQDVKSPDGYLNFLKKDYGDVLEKAWNKAKHNSVVTSPSSLVDLCKYLKDLR